MRKLKKGLSFIVAVVMLLSALPTVIFAVDSEDVAATDIETAIAAGENEEAAANTGGAVETNTDEAVAAGGDEVVYNLGSQEITVGNNAEQAAETPWSYKMFDEGGSYTIRLEDNAFFPYEVQFKAGGITTEEWFDTPESTVQIQGHTFSVHSEQNDDTKIRQIGVWVDGVYVAARPEPKTFDNPEFQPFSLLPLREVNLSLNLITTDRFQAGAMPVTTILSGLSPAQTIDGSAKVAWARIFSFTDHTRNGSYEIVEQADRINLSTFPNLFNMELIVGSARQLDDTNTRYIVSVSISRDSTPVMESVDMYVEESGVRSAAVFADEWGWDDFPDAEYTFALPADITAKQTYFMGITLNAAYRNYSVRAYEGFYYSELSAKNAAEINPELDVTSRVINQNLTSAGSGLPIEFDPEEYYIERDYTLLFYEGDVFVGLQRVFLEIWKTWTWVGIGELYTAAGSQVARTDAYSWDEDNDAEIKTFTLRAEFPASAEYFLRLEYIKDSIGGSTNRTFITKAVLGHFNTLEAAAAAADIKDALFPVNESATGAGYAADYSGNGQNFTVFAEGRVYKITVKAEDAPPGSIDFYGASLETATGANVVNTLRYSDENNNWTGTYTLYAQYPANAQYYLKLQYTKDGSTSTDNHGFITKAVVGHFDTLEAAAAAADIKDVLFPESWYASGAGYAADYSGNGQNFTVFADGQAIKFTIRAVDSPPGNVTFSNLSTAGGITASWWASTNTEDGVRFGTFTMSSSYPANADYYLRLSYSKDGISSTANRSFVTKAVVGHFATLEAAAAAPDIKDALFPASLTAGTGYLANFSGNGRDFTVFAEGNAHRLTVRAIDAPPIEPYEYVHIPMPGSRDTHFTIEGATVGDSNRLDTYLLPYHLDTYYDRGFQTVLVNNAVVDLDSLKPVFWNASTATVTAPPKGTNESAVEQVSGITEQSFSGGPVQYTVIAEDGMRGKNYWVSFVRLAQGPSLFVNGINGDKGPLREVFLDNIHDYRHNIFIANVGNESIVGLNVKLENAENIQLDPYWTVGGENNNILRPFTSTSEESELGELWNVAMIRLIPGATLTGDGKVRGMLTISADNLADDVVIELTGAASDPTIVTEETQNGVKFIPYSAVLQTNNMYDDWNEQSWAVWDSDTGSWSNRSADLPPGFELRQNGEIYGMPMEVGTYTFRVRVRFSGADYAPYFITFPDQTKTFTITIDENTEDNVADQSVGIIRRIQHMRVFDNQDFEIDHAFSEWTGLFFLNGQELVEGVDYDAKEGSTVITIRSQTFRNAGNGTHTVAAEFRDQGGTGKTMSVGAQNYTAGASGQQGSNQQRPQPGSMPQGGPQSQQQPDSGDGQSAGVTIGGMLFNDLSAGAWHFEYIKWAVENGYMIGVGDNLFAPSSEISGAMVVTVLARLAEVDLSLYADMEFEDIAPGEWYSEAAAWAKSEGILGSESFNPNPPLYRGRLAVMLLKFIDYIGIEYELPAANMMFTDLGQMTAEEIEAFRIMYELGIFIGVGNNSMAPRSSTTRAQLSTLLYRLSNLMENSE